MRGGIALSAEELVRRHVRRFNDGVRTGDFSAMLEGFSEDAELLFEGVPAGPFFGRSAISEAYRSRPPDDEIEVLSILERGNAEIVAAYSWKRDGGRRSGEMIFTPLPDGRVARLIVTFDDQVS